VRIAIGSDERAPVVESVRRHLEGCGHTVTPVAVGEEWPEVGRRVGEAVVTGEAERGVAFCNTGTGVSIAANKVAGVRAALCRDAATAVGARRWNDANVLALALAGLGPTEATDIVDAFLATDPDPGESATIARIEASVR
jgi:ribose 5-phosphate isomerase B